MRIHAVVALAPLLLFALAAHADDEATAPLGFSELAYSIPLQPMAEKPVLRIVLPAEVYAGVVRADLADVRVFNDDGQQVPFAIRTLDAAREVDGDDVALPFFPLHSEGGELPVIEGLSVAVQHGESSARVDLRALLGAGLDAGSDAGAPPPVGAYILDTSAVEHPIVALRIELRADDPDYVLPVRVESSDDLSSFRQLADGATLVDLQYGGARITRDRIDLGAARAPFLRLLPRDDAGFPGPITAVYAELQAAHEPAPRESLRVHGVAREGEPGVYDFDLGGFVPADRARVLLPQDNMLVEATLRSSEQAGDDDGQAVFSGSLYRVLREGERLESPAIDFSRRSHRYWSLHVDGKGGGLGGAVPQLELSRHPDQLLFVARGNAPYHLAFGHHAAGPARFSAAQVLDLMPQADREHHADDARAGQRETRAGERALSPPPPPPPYKRYLLWAVLILGAVGLGVSALRMLRPEA